MDQKNIHRIAVLTSGGDAPGMNAVVRAVVRTACANNIEVLGINHGYSGLINNDFRKMAARSVDGLLQRGGTVLYTARCMEMLTPEGQKRAADNCRYLGIDGLVCCGGDGTYRGALALARLGVPCIGIPGTIDNDIGCTEYTVGFDTASNTAINCIDKLRDTMQSHERISVVEVMGRRAGHLALNVGCSVGAAAVLVPEHEGNFESDVIEKIRQARISGRHHHIVIVAEGYSMSTQEVADRVQEETGMDTRVTILGHIQRGGAPTVRDRVFATRMGNYAVRALMEGKEKRIVAVQHGQVVDIDIEEALAMTKPLDEELYAAERSMSI
jgi:6-phosphofructokinase 1